MDTNCKRLLMLFISISLGLSVAYAQQTAISVSGTVSTPDRKPLENVSVKPKDARTVVTTAADGSFQLKVTKPGTVIVFSLVGYLPKELAAVKGSMNVVLQPAETTGEDVVVVGYATVKRKDLTGAVSSVGAKQLKDIPLTSAAQALTGRLAGVQITTAEGSPDADIQIRIRGGNSITQDNSPIYIIDGVQVENGLAGLAPQDIASIDVLKDASSTAIYGARGANGVVIITTKTGKAMKTVISYNGFLGTSRLVKKLPVMSPYEFAVWQWERDASYATGAHPVYGTWADIQQFKNTPAVDWQERVLNNKGLQQTHNVSVSGGTKTTQFNLSGTYNKQDGIVLNSGYDRKLINFRFAHAVDEHLSFGITTRYNNQVVTGAGTSDAGMSAYSKLRNTIKYRPMMMKGAGDDQIDESYYEETNTGFGLAILNPVALSNGEYNKVVRRFLNLSGYINYSFLKSFAFRTTIGFDRNTTNTQVFKDYFTPEARVLGGGLPWAGITDLTASTFNLSNTLTYNTVINKKHRLILLGGSEIYNTSNLTLDNKIQNYPIGTTAEKALSQPTLGVPFPQFPTITGADSRSVSFFSRANYAYNDKYLLTLTARADASSKFAPENRWGYFPSGALAWRVSREDFMKKIKWISDLKLRVSYGQVGNNRIPDYLYFTSYKTTGRYNLNEVIVPAAEVTALANRNLKWEVTTSRDIGIDVSLFNGRVQLTADAYRNTTNDLLVNSPIPYNSGFKTQLQNIGKTENKGLEFQLGSNIISHKHFRWTADFNISFNRNKIIQLAAKQQSYTVNSNVSPNGYADYLVAVGQPVGTMLGWVSDGFYKVDDFNWTGNSYVLKKGQPDPSPIFGQKAAPGMMKYRDINNDGLVNQQDQTIIGDPNPRFTGGLNQQLAYGQFDMSVFVNFVCGNKIFNANKVEFTNGYTDGTNLLGMMQNRWHNIDANGNPVTDPAQLAALNQHATIWSPKLGPGAFTANSWAIEDGSFLRINNITLGYTLPPAVLKRMRLSNLRVYATVNNLCVLSGYSGYDPEANVRGNGGVISGIDYSAYPRSRSYFVGLNLSF